MIEPKDNNNSKLSSNDDSNYTKKNNLVKPITFSLIIIALILIVSVMLIKFIKHKEEKNLNKKMYAKIIDEDTTYERDEEEKTVVKNCSFHYEYTVNGKTYTGYGSSRKKKYVGRSIKIFYSQSEPQYSETSEEYYHYLKGAIGTGIIGILVLLVIASIN